jgi:hypothetical protein
MVCSWQGGHVPVRRLLTAFSVWCAAALILGTAGASARGLTAPPLQTPANGASLQQMPALTWGAVNGASTYQYELAADPRFGAIALGSGTGKGSSRTHNTSAALDQDIPDGTYYWRVRGFTSKDSAGPWSAVRRVTKAWTAAPTLIAPNALGVQWPADPLLLQWSPVPYAAKYLVQIATDPSMSNVINDKSSNGTVTDATDLAVPGTLASGTYYWAVTPEDSDGRTGTRSAVGSFTWTWPTATTTSVTNLNPDPRVVDPQFSWAPIPGAASYQVEVNASSQFAPGSKWCCNNVTTGTSLSPTIQLANNAYYWRVRALDPQGNAGQWNYGPSFSQTFDNSSVTIPNLTMRDVNGNVQAGAPVTTDTPIVTWDPVPGASRYEVQVANYTNLGCDWSVVGSLPDSQTETATTGWTPLGQSTVGHIGPSAWPSPQNVNALPTGHTYCVRVLARADDDAKSGQVVSGWTQINGPNQPAFTYSPPPPPGTASAPFVMPSGNYIAPANGITSQATPMFTWNRVAGAQGYYVVIARDPLFTQVADVGFTNVPGYAPRLANQAPLVDQTASYYWAVIPTTGAGGDGAYSSTDIGSDTPQAFTEASVPPSLTGPANGAVISSQPTFSWTSALGARNYELQVSADPTFGNPIDDVTTDSTAYTSSSTYPADTALYWRVRANNWNGQGLNWSATQQFVRDLPAPTPSSTNPTGGQNIPALMWNPVSGAVSYDMHVSQVDGTTKDFKVASTAFTPVQWYGVGVWRWQVRAEFPNSSGTGSVPGSYSAPVTFVRTLQPPTGVYGVKTGSRMLIAWNSDPWAKQYQVDVSTTDGFGSTVDSHRVDGTSWAPDIDLTQAQNKGLLYWRVAAVDEGGNVGTFAQGSFGNHPPARCVAKKPKKGKKVSGCAKKKPKKKSKKK